ncbi:MAG TPA: hypothetical protein VFA90_11510 [Terriglobales bacterium]|nr:hypothetical protein [Terriglobales bacterium]
MKSFEQINLRPKSEEIRDPKSPLKKSDRVARLLKNPQTVKSNGSGKS